MKAKPGRITFGSGGNGTLPHLTGELFASVTGIKMTHVPYKGAGAALSDTIGGQIDVIFNTTAVALPHVKSGRLRALAVTTTKRLPAEPENPTIAESGVAGYEVISWHGLIGPKGLPRLIVDRINAEVMKTLNLTETAEKFQSDGVSPTGGTPEQFLATIKKEIEVWRKVVSDAGVKAE